MSLMHTILGFLSWKPMTGYELKKLFSDTDFIYWSGNNNQIYKSLVELGNDGMVSKEVVQQENYPAKKIYSITAKGTEELNSWASSTPEFTQVKNTFLMQLAWSFGLSDNEIKNLIFEYRHGLEMRLAMCREKIRRGTLMPSRTGREEYIWQMIWQREVDEYVNEINWLTKVMNGISGRTGK